MKKITFFVLAALVLVALPGRALAGEKEIQQEISDSIIHTYVECGVYFSITSEAIKKTDPGDAAAEQYRKLSQSAFRLAFETAQEGRSKEMAEKYTSSKIKAALDSMMAEIGGNLDNVSLLQERHAKPCGETMEDHEKTVQHWRDTINRRHQGQGGQKPSGN